jgi:hypothetical protein
MTPDNFYPGPMGRAIEQQPPLQQLSDRAGPQYWNLIRNMIPQVGQNLGSVLDSIRQNQQPGGPPGIVPGYGPTGIAGRIDRAPGGLSPYFALLGSQFIQNPYQFPGSGSPYQQAMMYYG